jgi:hypothetical protein
MGATLELVRAYLAADVPVLLWGPPGVGKTAAILALARETGAHAEVLIGSTLDPIDVGGYLVPHADGVRQSPAPWARRLVEALEKREPAWLVLDELSCAPPSVQAALLRLVHERRAGEVDLTGIRVVAAANPSDTAADGGELTAATANRWAHLNWEVDVGEWASGTLRGWVDGHSSTRKASIAAGIAAFVQRHPKSLLTVPLDIGAAGRAWPSPRAWTAAIAAAAAGPDSLARRLVAGCVGEGAAAEWDSYRASLDLPDPEEILAGRAKLPARGDRTAASLLGVVSAAIGPHANREGRMLSAWRLLLAQRADLGVVPARALLDADGSVPEIAAEYAARLRKGGVA